jgi:hypothetical protein
MARLNLQRESSRDFIMERERAAAWHGMVWVARSRNWLLSGAGQLALTGKSLWRIAGGRRRGAAFGVTALGV